MNYGKFHTGECRKRSFNCFECGEVGHFKRDCALLIQFGGSGRGTVIPRNQNGGRSFVSNRDRKSTRLNSSHSGESRMPSSA